MNADTERRVVRKALLARAVENRFLSLFSEGKLFGTVHTCIGQELSGAVITELLGPGDAIFSSHRCHGHYLCFTGDVEGLIAEVMGKASGTCGGIGGSQHLYKDGFFSNGVQGGIVPVAAGLAMARKLKKQGKISVVFIGDGTLGEGAVYESFNIASKWRLPLLIVLEDNGYAQSTSKSETLAGDITARAAAFGIRCFRADTWDWRGLYETAGEAARLVRSEMSPAFLLVDTYRLKAHSKGDDDRPRSEVAAYEEKDPLTRWMAEHGAEAAAWAREAEARVDEAVRGAEQAAYPVGKTGIRPKSGDRRPETEESGSVPLRWRSASVKKQRVVTALNQLFHELMERHPEMIFLGEDIRSPYGGAFKVTKGLSDRFPERVLNTPISEGAIVGVGSGLGMEGFRPFVEIMFGDFSGLAFDQILNYAAKFEQMYNGQVTNPVVVRTPMGGGRGYGPTHSQTLDRHFFGIPGLTVLALNNLVDPVYLYRPLLGARRGPTLVIENKLLYGAYLREEWPAGFRALVSDEEFPTVHLQPDSERVDVTLLGYGGLSDTLVQACDRLFEEHDVVAQAFCPMRIYPFDMSPLLPLIPEGSRLVLIEEGQGFAGFGAEALAQVAENAPRLAAGARRIHAAEGCIPASGPLEKETLPGMDRIIAEVLERR